MGTTPSKTPTEVCDPKTQREVCLTADDFYRVHSTEMVYDGEDAEDPPTPALRRIEDSRCPGGGGVR
jgi:hypothetical protein